MSEQENGISNFRLTDERYTIFMFGKFAINELSVNEEIESVDVAFNPTNVSPDATLTIEYSDNRPNEEYRIEFEGNSKSFLTHGHDPKSCDLIVCMNHNWKETPLPVLELMGKEGPTLYKPGDSIENNLLNTLKRAFKK